MLLQTKVLMKTDIAGSTPRFRAALASDLQALLLEHRSLVERLAASEDGQIVSAAGDGYWLEFPSVTAAARSAIAMQAALRLEQRTKGDDRLSMRAVIGVGDVAMQNDDPIGEVLALITRIETVTPADEIYLTSAARQVLVPAEIQTVLVDSFALKGFAEPIAVYRVDARHRTHIIADACILVIDLRGFTQLMQTASVDSIEQVLDALDALIIGIAREFDGVVRFSVGDSYLVTFAQADRAMAAADRIDRDWQTKRHSDRPGGGIHMVLHRGTINIFRSFLYGDGSMVAGRVLAATTPVLVGTEGGVFITNAFRDQLSSDPWHSQLEAVVLERPAASIVGVEVYRLCREEAVGRTA
jgi:class 3 adenylate cyclase